MSFKKGQIFEFDFPVKKHSKVIEFEHRVVVLYSRTTPYNTMTIAPITSLQALENKNKVPLNYLKLKKENYPFILDHDSYINLDMILTVDGDDLKQFERNGIKVAADLNKTDLEDLDYRLALTYELQSFVKNEVDKEVQNEVKTIIEYIDTDIREKVTQIMQILNDPVAIRLLDELINIDLLQELKNNYT